MEHNRPKYRITKMALWLQYQKAAIMHGGSAGHVSVTWKTNLFWNRYSSFMNHPEELMAAKRLLMR